MFPKQEFQLQAELHTWEGKARQDLCFLETALGRARGVRLETGENFFTGRVARNWNRLPKEVVESPRLKMFKKPVQIFKNVDVALGKELVVDLAVLV